MLNAWLETEFELGQPTVKRFVERRVSELQEAIELTSAVVGAEAGHTFSTSVSGYKRQKTCI